MTRADAALHAREILAGYRRNPRTWCRQKGHRSPNAPLAYPYEGLCRRCDRRVIFKPLGWVVAQAYPRDWFLGAVNDRAPFWAEIA
jgi:hypothetical protein